MFELSAGAKIGALILGLVLIGVHPASASSPVPSGAIQVVLVDAQDHSPVAYAEVNLYGPQATRGVTNASGSVQFENLQPGVYIVVPVRYEYEQQTVRNVHVWPHQTSTIAIYLTRRPTSLQVIANVRSKPQAPLPSMTQSSTSAQLKQSLVDALSFLPSVSLLDGIDQSVSIQGHLPNETGVYIEGSPVLGFGTTPNLRLFNADLFSEVGIDTGAAVPSSGGDINFKMREPTLDWVGSLGTVQSGYGSGLTLSEGGTVGRLGVAYSHGDRSQADALNGLAFLDTSGLTYSHDTLSHTYGDALKLRYPFSLNQVLTATVASLNSKIPFVCHDFTGPIPCGYGPDNAQRLALQAEQIKDSLFFNSGSASVTLFHSKAQNVFDQLNFFVNGTHEPATSQGATSVTGLSAASSISIRRSRSINISVLNSSQTTTSSGGGFGAILPPLASSLTYTNITVSTKLFDTRRLSANVSAGSQSDSFSHGAVGSVALSWRPSNVDTLTASIGTGNLGIPGGSFTGVSPAQALHFNCDADNAVGNGPSSNARHTTTSSFQGVWQHQGARVQSAITLYRQVENSGDVSGIVAAEAVPSTLFTPGYFSTVTSLFQSSCRTNKAIDAQNLFLRLSEPADRVIFQGINALVNVRISPNVIANASYGITTAVARGAAGPLFSDRSTIIDGNQLPGIPLHSFSVGAAAALGKGDISAFGLLHFVSANNPNALPAYSTVDLGVTASTPNGAAAFTVTNAFNAHAGAFYTDNGAVPLRMLSGQFLGPMVPLPPRTYVVGYRLRVGPGMAGQRESFFGNGFLVRWYPVTPSPVGNILEPNRKAPSCGPESIGIAEGALKFIASFVTDIEAAKTNGTYPTVLPSRTYDGLTLVYRSNGPNDFGILIEPASGAEAATHQNAARPLLICGLIHGGSIATFQQFGIFLPNYEEEQITYLGFSPKTGLFFPPELIEAPAAPNYLPLPSGPPTQPFTVNATSACTPNVRPAAQAILGLISDYAKQVFEMRTNPLPVPELNIVLQRNGKLQWMEIRDTHAGVLHDIGPCLNVVRVPKTQLKSFGYDGLPWIQGVNYAPALGLYVSQ